ncbi:hypothetical protein [Klebsiella variicola]|uniref:hypothetical protein n=1 Tax=Klebsiella variicola TaxID=244366 RepID=UPI001E402AC7|nr:hypothetical protein [Klebsiella variicola]MCE0393881.1 hypothetical protein [Klebsiella variicola subsp. variicola]
MTSKLTRERLAKIAAGRVDARRCNDDEIAMAITLLAAMGSEPVAALKLPPKLSNDRERAHELNTGVDIWNRCIDEVAKINGEMIIAGRVDGLHPSTMALVNDFATALAEKLHKAELKYGYSNAWINNGWMTDCLAEFHRHIAKGDPRDVAAYCAFMWYHGWKTEAAQPAPVVPDGYVMVPKEATKEILDEFDSIIDYGAEDSVDAWHRLLAAAPQPQNAPQNIPEIIPDCWCRTCRPVVLNDMRFVVCPDCGNKRCPRANDHRNACTGSNEPGQEGSAYPAAPQEVK